MRTELSGRIGLHEDVTTPAHRTTGLDRSPSGLPVRHGHPSALSDQPEGALPPPRTEREAPASPATGPAVEPRRRSRASIERGLGRTLRLMRACEGFRRLGFVRLGDFVQERLDVSHRTAQEWMRVDEALERLPRAAAAFDAGEITSGHVRILSRVAGEEDEAWWVALARRTSVRELAAAVVRGRAAGAGASSGHDGPAEAGRDDARKGRSTDTEAAGDGLSEDEEASVRLQIAAPAWAAGMWRDTVAFARRLAGAPLSQGECLEVVLAESSGLASGEDGAEDSGTARRHLTPSARVESATSGFKHSRSGAGRDLIPSARADLKAPGFERVEPVPGVNLRSSAPSRAGEPERLDGPPPDPRALDRVLRGLAGLLQRQDADLAELLRGAAILRSYREAGFSSLEDYARERYGVAPRRLYILLSLQKTLASLPHLRAAFLDGRLGLKRALLVGSVATVVTEAAWIERARSVTLRRLEDEVAFWRRLKESRPAVWEMLDGDPLPEGLLLAPGRPPDLIPSAPRPEEQMSAERLLRALQEDEAAVPLPDRICTIRLLVEPAVVSMWEEARVRLREASREPVADWEILVVLMREFWRVWDNPETRRQRRENPVLERDGWRCMAPACRSIGTGRLHVHHVVFRSAGGTDEPSGLCALCVGHHLGLLHEGRIRCSGRAPGNLAWELGVEPGREPFLVYRGETRVAGAAG